MVRFRQRRISLSGCWLKHLGIVALIFCLTGCASYPENPTPDDIIEMRLALDKCIDDIVPLEAKPDRQCVALEKALINHYGSLDAFMDAQKRNK